MDLTFSVVRGRIAPLAFALAVLGAACGMGGVDEGGPTATPPSAANPSLPVPTSDVPAATGTLPADETPTNSGRPVAPDFTLQLGEGGSYTLSEGEMPVYLVFWAEW